MYLFVKNLFNTQSNNQQIFLNAWLFYVQLKAEITQKYSTCKSVKM